MTVAPFGPRQFRFDVVLGCTVLDLVLAGIVWRVFGLGPAIFLLAIGAVGVVNLVMIARGRDGKDPASGT